MISHYLIKGGESMAIKVRVINVDPNNIEPSDLGVQKDDEPAKILTSDYVREVNLGIAYRTMQRMAARSDEPIFD